tara:strand:+ start:458 stop:841 length:384 start_codon:yes stop_codon:yes gene_type:complete
MPLPVKATHLECGFPSPADDYTELDLDLNEYLINRPAATYFAWATGDSLIGEGVHDGDLLIVDRAAQRIQGSVVVVSLDGQLACKILDIKNRCFRSSNPAYPPIPVPEDMDVVIEGVVTHVIHRLIP